MLITPGDVVINADGTYPLEPGDYSAVGRVGGEVVTDAVPFTIEACPTAAPTEGPTEASILIAKLDSRGTDTPEDDVLLDGASFEVYLDDGDEAFDDGDELVFGAAATSEGMLDTDLLEAGWYWIVEVVVPEGYTGSDPILVELNTDPSITCIWDSHGLIECEDNEGDVDDLSWTIVLVDNTPVSGPTDAPPTGGVGGATGTPGGAGVTLPPTDTLNGWSRRPGRRRLAPHPPGDGRSHGRRPPGDPGNGRGPTGRRARLTIEVRVGAPAVPEHRRPSGPKGPGGRSSAARHRPRPQDVRGLTASTVSAVTGRARTGRAVGAGSHRNRTYGRPWRRI